MIKIMIVDDELSISETLGFRLQREGYQVQTASTGKEALRMVEEFKPNLVVLDIMLPDIDGLEICRQIRTQSIVPVLMLTARGDEVDRVLGLEVGADDYLVKPFSYRELLARIRAMLRRLELDRKHQKLLKSTQIGSIKFDPKARRIWKGEEEIKLSSREFDLLQTLISHAGQVIARQDIFDQVWGPNWFGDQHTLDVHIRWLRLKIEDDPTTPQYIQTMRGYGYRFVGPEEMA